MTGWCTTCLTGVSQGLCGFRLPICYFPRMLHSSSETLPQVHLKPQNSTYQGQGACTVHSGIVCTKWNQIICVAVCAHEEMQAFRAVGVNHTAEPGEAEAGAWETQLRLSLPVSPGLQSTPSLLLLGDWLLWPHRIHMAFQVTCLTPTTLIPWFNTLRTSAWLM